MVLLKRPRSEAWLDRMTRWPVSDEAAREMYAGGHGNETARRWARLWTRVFDLGLLPRRWVTLEVSGRTTGRTRAFPLGMADLDGRWYLVSMLGECSWVANVRAAGGDVVLRRRRRRPAHLVEVPAVVSRPHSPPLRREGPRRAATHPDSEKARPFLCDFARIADRYPVFEMSDVPQG